MQLRTSEQGQTRTVSPLIDMIEVAADGVDWQPVDPFRWLGRSALLQRGRSRIAVIAPRRDILPEVIQEQAARLRAHSVRGIWLVPPNLAEATRPERQDTPILELLDGTIATPGHGYTPISEFIQGALSGRLKWVFGPCPSVYGLWVVETKCPSCRTRQQFPAGALWLRGATYDEKPRSCPPPLPLLPLDPEGIDDVRAFTAALARPASLSRDHLGIAAHCGRCGCVLPCPDRKTSKGYLHVTSVSAPVIERGWWSWDGWPRQVSTSAPIENGRQNYSGCSGLLN
jgi:hypothetical protein